MIIHWLPTIDSTNSEALRRLRELPSGSVLAAREQTAGRGQRGNSWFSEPGTNLTFSVVLKFSPGELAASNAHRLNYLASVSVVDLLGEEDVSAQVKWPNDIYVGRRKICGILVENTLGASGVEASVIGVGLNVNQREFPQLANATSLHLCTGRQFDLPQMLERYCALMEKRLPSLLEDSLLQTYTALLFQKGTSSVYQDYLKQEQFTGVIEGVAPDGRLLVRDPAGQIRRYHFKELGYII